MGDRVSIQFKNGNERSMVLFSHWGGVDLLNKALEYTKTIESGELHPLSRKDPSTVMVDFIRHSGQFPSFREKAIARIHD